MINNNTIIGSAGRPPDTDMVFAIISYEKFNIFLGYLYTLIIYWLWGSSSISDELILFAIMGISQPVRLARKGNHNADEPFTTAGLRPSDGRSRF